MRSRCPSSVVAPRLRHGLSRRSRYVTGPVRAWLSTPAWRRHSPETKHAPGEPDACDISRSECPTQQPAVQSEAEPRTSQASLARPRLSLALNGRLLGGTFGSRYIARVGFAWRVLCFG